MKNNKTVFCLIMSTLYACDFQIALAALFTLIIGTVIIRCVYQRDLYKNGYKNHRNRMSRKHEDVNSGVPIVVTEHVEEYRKAVVRYVKKGDNCLEVGCHRGTTTNIIKNQAKQGRVVGIDLSGFQLNFAKENYADIEFIKMDGFDIRKIIKLGIKWDIVLIDVSGSRDLKALIPLIESYEKALRPRMFIVKSIKFTKLLHQSVLFDDDAN